MVNYLHISDNFAKFVAWIGGSCKPSDKGKLTPFPRFTFCQHNFNNVSSMLRFEELPEVNSERWLSLEDLTGEIWKNVVGFEELFSISCYGRLKRKERYSYYSNSKSCFYKEKIIKTTKQNTGYYVANLSLNGKRTSFSIHREVAKAFIPNTENLPFINHKDENPSNNCVFLNDDGTLNVEKSNLEWCTPKYNSNYGTSRNRIRQQRIEKGFTHAVILYSYDGKAIKRYETEKDAERDTGISRGTIENCCRGVAPTAKGRHFRYENEDYVPRVFCRDRNIYEVYKNNDYLFTTDDTKLMCSKLGVNYSVFRKFFKYRKGGCKGIEEYTIIVTKQEGRKVKIENGLIIEQQLWTEKNYIAQSGQW